VIVRCSILIVDKKTLLAANHIRLHVLSLNHDKNFQPCCNVATVIIPVLIAFCCLRNIVYPYKDIRIISLPLRCYDEGSYNSNTNVSKLTTKVYHRYLHKLFGMTFTDCISYISCNFTELNGIVRLQDRKYNGSFVKFSQAFQRLLTLKFLA
jgi:hypothetical protein